MDFIFITGKLGQGKTLAAMAQIKLRIERGCTVATNCDIFLDKMFGQKTDKPRVIRIPDKPTIEDLEIIGRGYDSKYGYDESKNGLLVLDECGTWFNSRNWQDKTRMAVNNWMLHARKLGWDVYLIVQDISIIDNQARDALAAGVARCKRLDKIRIPWIGSITKSLMGWELRPPKVHSARIEDDLGLLLDRWVYRGTDLYHCYDTRQAFRSDYPHGVHSLLTPWHRFGRYLRPSKNRTMRLTKIYFKKHSRTALLCFGMLLGSAFGLYQSYKLTGSISPVSGAFTPPGSIAPGSPLAAQAFKDKWAGWSYDGSQSINRNLVFFLVNPEGIRIPSSDSIFEGITLSEPSSCAIKLQLAKDSVFLKCRDSSEPKPKTIMQGATEAVVQAPTPTTQQTTGQILGF